MKHKNKKNRLKIFIALSLMITTIFGVMFATNTHAYSSDRISYTITNISKDDFFTTNDEIDNNDDYIDINYDINKLYFFNSNTSFSYAKYYICINYIYLNSNNEPYTSHNATRFSTQPSCYINGNWKDGQIVYCNNYQYNYNGTYYTQIIPITLTTYWNSGNEPIVKFSISGIGNHIRIYNIDIVSDNDIGLSQYYETYYSQIEDQYDQLLDDYNDLQDDYNSLETNYDNLQDNYDTLENDYNDLQNEYNGINNIGLNGMFSYINYYTQYYDANDVHSYTYDELVSNNILNNGRINANLLINNTANLVNIYNDIEFYTTLNNHLDFYNFSFYYEYDTSHFSQNNLDPIISFELCNAENINDTITLNINGNLNMQVFHYVFDYEHLTNYFTQYDYDIYNYVKSINFTYILRDEYNSNNEFILVARDSQLAIAYKNGYDDGYQVGISIGKLIAGNYEQELINANNEITQLNITISSLNEQIRAQSDPYNLNSLIWTIGGVPFESFKHIWNVNFLGINIADFILGFITTFIGIYVLKKFFF